MNKFIVIFACILSIVMTLGSSSDFPNEYSQKTSENIIINANLENNCIKNSFAKSASATKPCMYNAKCECYQTCYHVTAAGKCVHFGYGCRP